VLAQTANGNFLYTKIIKTAKIGQIRANRQQQAKIDTAPTIYAHQATWATVVGEGKKPKDGLRAPVTEYQRFRTSERGNGNQNIGCGGLYFLDQTPAPQTPLPKNS